MPSRTTSRAMKTDKTSEQASQEKPSFFRKDEGVLLPLDDTRRRGQTRQRARTEDAAYARSRCENRSTRRAASRKPRRSANDRNALAGRSAGSRRPRRAARTTRAPRHLAAEQPPRRTAGFASLRNVCSRNVCSPSVCIPGDARRRRRGVGRGRDRGERACRQKKRNPPQAQR